MPMVVRCPRGHVYPIPDVAIPPGDTSALCPICSTRTEVPAMRIEAVATPTATVLEPLSEPVSPTSFADRRTLELEPWSVPMPDRATVELGPDRTAQPPGTAPSRLDDVPAPPGYELLRELGRGGMGVVYQARRVADGQVVALKMILGGSQAGPAERERFLAEAETLIQLRHPNIVRVLEVGDVQGRAYFSLEYVSGGTLADSLRGLPQEAAFAARVVAQLARAIDAAHARGVVHRDLKPANVLVGGPDWGQHDDAPPRPGETLKIADFGLARYCNADPDRTRAGWIVGTPAYMAPEQAAGNSRLIGPPVDIWALGAILYECLTGRPPFQGATALETLDQVREHDPVPPRRLAPNVPRDLETVCLKCLHKDPRRRYRTATGLARDLERFLAGKPVLARRPTPTEHASRWVRRNPLLATILLSCLTGLLLLVAGAIWHTLRLEATLASEAEAKADLQGKQAELEAREAQLRQYRYTAHIQQAQRLWAQGDLTALRGVLAPYTHGDQHGLRDFACRHLEYQLAGSLATFTGHASDVYQVAWVPATRGDGPGMTLVSVGKDGTLRFWGADGEPRRTVAAHDDEVNAVAVSPDGGRVATGGDDGRIRLWDAATGDAGPTLVAGDKVVALQFSGDGRTLYAGLDKGHLTAWSLGQPAIEPRRVVGPVGGTFGGRIQGLALSPDGRRLAVAGEEKALTLIDLANNEATRALDMAGSKPLSVAFAPSGRRLAVGCNDGLLRVFDVDPAVEMPTELVQVKGHVDRVFAVAFTPDEELLISVGQDSQVRLWSLAQTEFGPVLEPEGSLKGHVGRIWTVAVSPDGRFLATGGQDGRIKLWPPRGGADFQTIEPAGKAWTPLYAVARNSGQPVAVFASKAGIEMVTIERGGNQAPTRQDVGGEVHSVAVSPDLRQMLFGRASDEIFLRDLATGATRHLLTTQRQERPVAFSDGGDFAAAATSQGKVHVWWMPDGVAIATAIAAESSVTALAFQPRTGRLLVAEGAGRVSLWALDGKKPAATWVAHIDNVLGVAFSPDGTRLATTGKDRSVRLWDPETGKEINHGLLGHGDFVFGAAFSPDGRNLATAGQDGTVRLWSLATGGELLRLEQPGPARGVVFLDATRLLVVGHDADEKVGYVRIYHAAAPE